MPRFMPGRGREGDPSSTASVRRRWQLIAIGATLVEVLALAQRGYRFGGNVVVRCRRDHLFTTIWVPAASLKSLRLAWWRIQWCPVGRHWSVVTPVRKSELTEDQKRTADDNPDIRIP